MSVDAATTDRATRPTIAQLTLRLRAAEHEAEQAEAEEAGWDLDAALVQLRARLAPLVAERRRALDDELVLERVKAAEAVAAAGTEAEAIIESARAAAMAADAAFADLPLSIDASVDIVAWDPGPSDDDHDSDREHDDDETAVLALVEPDIVPDTVPDIVPDTVLAVVEPDIEPDTVPDTEPDIVPADIDEVVVGRGAPWPPPASQQSSATPLPAPIGQPLGSVPPIMPAPQTPAITVTLDPDAFARAFAAALAAMMDERLAPMPIAQPQHPQWVQAASGSPARRSFWANAWHADVILSLVAALIVVVILIAWST